ncbi:hypothetical protein [Streptosporangium album]|uniref:hypothetical protein n=1 Tax=Streptosporangium album TaxID=47479 RepID=UPI0031EAFE6E
MLNGIQVAEAPILSGAHRKVLVCSGEVPSRAPPVGDRRGPVPSPTSGRPHRPRAGRSRRGAVARPAETRSARRRRWSRP